MAYFLIPPSQECKRYIKYDSIKPSLFRLGDGTDNEPNETEKSLRFASAVIDGTDDKDIIETINSCMFDLRNFNRFFISVMSRLSFYAGGIPEPIKRRGVLAFIRNMYAIYEKEFLK